MLLVECWQYHEVFFNIISQDLKLKYKRTFFGFGWSLLHPLLQLTVFSVIFSHIARLDMEHYTLYLFSGLLAWTFFQSSLVSACGAFLQSENFIKKVYLPKLIFPLNKVIQRGIDFLLALVSLSLLGWVLQFNFHSTMLFIPLAIAPLFLFALGISIVTSIAKVYFRDAEYLLNLFLQLLYFATPILYPLTLLPESYQRIIGLSPIYIQIKLFQKLIYFGTLPTVMEWATAYSVSVFSLLVGLFVLISLEDDLVFRM